MDWRADYDNVQKNMQSIREEFLHIYNSITSKWQFPDPTGMKDACWTKVLSYLQLQDLISFSQCHPFFAATVDQFVSSGNPVTLDKSLGRSIISDDHDWTAVFRIGMSTKNLIVSGIESDDSLWLRVFIHGVTHLTWEKMEWLADDFWMLLTMTSIIQLKISNCRLGLSESNPLLIIPELRHLILEECDLNFGFFSLDSLESLQIIKSNVSRLFRFSATDRIGWADSDSLLGVLLREYNWRSWDQLEDGSALRDLHSNIPPSKIDNILKWTQLEHVNIHCKWYHAEQLRTHFQSLPSIRSCVVTCSAPSPGYDLWDSLNEDCLRMIMAYLTEYGLYHLLIADPRFIALHPVVRVDTVCVKLHPPETCAEFYQRMATKTVGLEISRINEDDFYNVIIHFPNITRLKLKGLRLRDLTRIPNIPLVSELILDNCGIKVKFWKPLYRHLNPSLRKLRLIDNEPRNMQDLTNIQELDLDSEISCSVSCLTKFFKRNRMLTNLRLEIYGLSNASLFLFLKSVNVDSLRHLNTTYSDDEEAAKILVQHINRFRNLETLICNRWCLTIDELNTITLTGLTVLEVRIMSENIVLDIVQKFRNLERLDVFLETEMSRSLLDRFEKCLFCLGKNFSFRCVKEHNYEYTFSFSPYFMG